MILHLILLTIGLFIYIILKLTFWKRQNIPNIVNHWFKTIVCNNQYLSDFQLIQKYGKIVGFVLEIN